MLIAALLMLIYFILAHGLGTPILAYISNLEEKAPLKDPMDATLPSLATHRPLISQKKEAPIKGGWVRLTTHFLPSDGYEPFPSHMNHRQTVKNDTKKPVSSNSQSKGAKEHKYIVLKHNTLVVYEADTMETCVGVTVLEDCLVELIPESLGLEELYEKHLPIKISNAKGAVFSRSNACYLYATNSTEKEDWYLLLKAAAAARDLKEGEDEALLDYQINFYKRLYTNVTSPHLDQYSQWFNAFVGRLFYNLHTQRELETYFLKKLNRKTSKLRKPFYMGDVIVKHVSVGQAVPLISNTQLHSLELSGELNVSADLLYTGGFRIQVETTAKIDLPKMKSFTIPLVLAILVKRVSGKILIRVKPPPSDRFWVGFYNLPNLELQIEPVISTKSVKWAVIHSVIEKRIKESVLEYLVLPNMDDFLIPRFRSEHEDLLATAAQASQAELQAAISADMLSEPPSIHGSGFYSSAADSSSDAAVTPLSNIDLEYSTSETLAPQSILDTDSNAALSSLRLVVLETSATPSLSAVPTAAASSSSIASMATSASVVPRRSILSRINLLSRSSSARSKSSTSIASESRSESPTDSVLQEPVTLQSKRPLLSLSPRSLIATKGAAPAVREPGGSSSD